MAFERFVQAIELPTEGGLVTITEVDLQSQTEWILRGMNVNPLPTDQPIRWNKNGLAHFDDTDRWNLDLTECKTAGLFRWIEAKRVSYK